MLASLPSDLYFAPRQPRKSPGFAFTAILTLALGIGTTTAIYSLIDGVLLKPLPLPHPEQLVAAYAEETRPGQTPDHIPTSYPNYLDWRDRNRTFTQLAAYAGDARLVSRTNGMEGAVLPICRITPNYFDALGIQPILGRNFTPADDQPGHHVVILSYGLWERLLASDRNVLGTTILVSDQPFTIVGVMPKGFTEPRSDDQSDLWTSFAPFLDGSAPRGKERDNGFAEAIGRLKPGSTQRPALADLATIQSSLAKSYPKTATSPPPSSSPSSSTSLETCVPPCSAHGRRPGRAAHRLEVAVLEKGERGLGVALDMVLVGDGTAEIGHRAPLQVRRAAGTAGWMLGMGSEFGSPRNWNAAAGARRTYAPDGRLRRQIRS